MFCLCMQIFTSLLNHVYLSPWLLWLGLFQFSPWSLWWGSDCVWLGCWLGVSHDTGLLISLWGLWFWDACCLWEQDLLRSPQNSLSWFVIWQGWYKYQPSVVLLRLLYLSLLEVSNMLKGRLWLNNIFLNFN